MRTVALATCERLPELVDDDRRLVRELARSGISARPAVWSDPSVDWSAFEAVVLRSTWDYCQRIQEFLAWVERASTDTTLWNPAEVVRWNSHKSYLRDLETAGVPIVPTRWCPGLSEALEVVRAERWRRAVLKPAVSAAGYLTYLVDAETSAQDPAAWDALAGVGDVLVQPYQEEVERSGERSLVFFLGEYSHAFLRAPRLAPLSGIVEGAPVAPSEEELRVARRALARTPGRTLYGRVDLVARADGRPQLMELEVIEPALELKATEGGAERFARAVSAVL